MPFRRWFNRVRRQKKQRDEPYLIQIGFDFGTSYSKCVCRDLITNTAWVYLPGRAMDDEYPFLIPGSICFEGGRFRPNYEPSIQYPEDGLYHLKLALEKAALGEWDDPALKPFAEVIRPSESGELRGAVERANVFFLANAFACVRRAIKRRYSDFGDLGDDLALVNMAIPVADASSPKVSAAFQGVLEVAWKIASSGVALNSMEAAEQLEILGGRLEAADEAPGTTCFIYPEISASVQGFVRSRSASGGIYMFTDVGAGTVDQSTFVFSRRDNGDWLTYLDSAVMPLGSSQIEQRAAKASGQVDPQALELWRQLKESDVEDECISDAQKDIRSELERGTYCTVGRTVKKLWVTKQLEEARLLFGGGGYSRDPYELAVSSQFGRPWLTRKVEPDVVGMPLPRDLELEPSQSRWMRRLYVAYGLSFYRSDLAGHTFPDDLPDVKAQERELRHDGMRSAPSKDDC